MAPLKRRRPQDEATTAPAAATEPTTRRATRQTSIAPLPILPDPEPRKRRRRTNTDEEQPDAPAEQSKPSSKSTNRSPPGMRGKENRPATQGVKPVAPRGPGRPPKTNNGLKPTPRVNSTSTTPLIPHSHKLGTTAPLTLSTSTPQPKPKPNPNTSHLATPSSASPHAPRGTKPSSDRNIDKVVLGDICFRAWYPSYYGKEVLGDSHQSQSHSHSNDSTGAGSKDGAAKGHGRDQPPPMLERLYICPCCFKYSTELVKWWEHVRICEARGFVPGRKIYTHPKGSRIITKPATDGPGGAGKTAKGGGKKGAGGGKALLEEVVRDQGEWSIWEVDGEKDVLFCQNLSLFAKLFLDNKSVFFDVTGFNYFLLVYTPPPPSPPPTATTVPLSPDTPTHTHTTSPSDDPSSSTDPPVQKHHIVGFFSKEKMSWDNNNLACILIFPPWQRKGLGSILMGVSYEISRREGVLGGPEKPISDLGKKGYKRFWAGEIARWLLSLELEDPDDEEEGKDKGGRDGKEEGEKREKVVDVETCSRETWIAVDDCLAVLREMDGVVVDAGRGVDPRKVREKKADGEGEETGEVEEVKVVDRVRVDKEAVRRWVVANGISLERTCDPRGFVDGYALKVEDDEEEETGS